MTLSNHPNFSITCFHPDLFPRNGVPCEICILRECIGDITYSSIIQFLKNKKRNAKHQFWFKDLREECSIFGNSTFDKLLEELSRTIEYF